jgi:hypothetical protein
MASGFVIASLVEAKQSRSDRHSREGGNPDSGSSGQAG